LVSRAFLDTPGGETPQVPLALLEAHAQGLICLSGGTEGPLGGLLLAGRDEEAERLARRFSAAFPGRFYIELQRHGSEAEELTEPGFLRLAYDLELPLIATNDVHFASRGQHEAHDALMCIAQRTTIGQRDRRRLTPEHYFKSAAEMRELFADLPEAVDNTLVVARRCAFRVPTRDPILPRYDDGTGRDQKDIMAEMAREGLEERLRAHVFSEEMDEAAREAAAQPYRERLEHEIGIIISMGFAGYFLIVADFIQWAKNRGIPVGPGRGSGAGSVAAWALKITDLDPLRFSLLFERFLNPERVSMPDFDIDFCQDKRDQVIRYVQDKYGHDQVAQIITFGKLQARAALRDVGRVLEMPFGLVDRLCKMVPNNPAKPTTLQQAVDGEPRLREAIAEEPGVDRLFDVALKLEGLYRHASTHAAGVVIGDRPLEELIPLYRDPHADMPVTQFNMKWVEPAGLIKFDFLGLKTLTVLDRAVQLIREREEGFTLTTIPLDDPGAYKLISAGTTVGVFQLEGSGMRDTLRMLKPDTFEDIIAVVALYRPGPMDNIPRFCNVKHRREQADYLHPLLEPVLKETYGVIVYQEQVMQIAQILAGYSLGEADLLRRAMGKKIQAEMDAQRERFVQGATERGVDQEQASYIFDLVNKFAGYGFNKSHAAAYALIAYQTAWLKANYPVEFMAASMSLELNNTDKLNVFKQEADAMGIPLLPPDVNRSGVEFTVERQDGEAKAIRYALAAIKNVGREAMRALVEEREANGPFADIWDFAGRLDPRQINKRQLENLARAGAFDSLQPNRAQMLEAADLMMSYAQQAAQDRQSDQVSLFGEGGSAAPPPPNLPARPDWTMTDRLGHEFEAIGFYLSAHPLDGYSFLRSQDGIVNYASLLERASQGGSRFRIAGTVLRKQERKNSRNNPYAFVQLSDPTGVFEVTVFAEELSANRELLEPGRSVLLTVDARMEGEAPRMVVQGIVDIDEASTQAGADIRVYLNDRSPLDSIRSLLESGRRGRASVTLMLALSEQAREVEIRLPHGYAMTPADRGALKAIPGVIDVREG
ncbi:MAG TPA: DNA polymerase III subunit alpha, partial [Alphaproteobacteria bacterium]|nr:DNA polymerase III subunit alpha [Alphaproteobacteria bacterium]